MKKQKRQLHGGCGNYPKNRRYSRIERKAHRGVRRKMPQPHRYFSLRPAAWQNTFWNDEHPVDDAIAEVFAVNERWQRGKSGFRPQGCGREDTRSGPRRKRPGQGESIQGSGAGAAIPHVKRHALIASDYAVTLINVMYPKNMEEVRKEREIQISLLESV